MSNDTPPPFMPPPPSSPQQPPPQQWPPPTAPASWVEPPPPPYYAPATPEGDKSFVVTVLLAYLLGMLGADRFYLGKTGTAVLKLLTFGGYGVWWLIDLLITLFGGQRDVHGRRLTGYDEHKKTVGVVVGTLFAATFALALASATITAAVDAYGPTTFGWVLVATIAVAAVTGVTVWLLRRRRARGTATRIRRGPDPVPARIRARITRLVALRPLYAERESKDASSPAVVEKIDSLAANLTELFQRLRIKADRPQRSLAEIEYEDKLGKLAAALDHDYLLDVLANPRLWDHPEERIREVQDALEAVDDQLLDNIRQVNAHRGLVFQVALDGLMGTRKAIGDWQRDFDTLSDTD